MKNDKIFFRDPNYSFSLISSHNLHQIANKLFINKKYKSAIKIYNLLLKKLYKIDIIYSNKAACYLFMKKYKNALEASLYSVQNNLKYSIAWGRIGYSYKGLKMYSESLKAFEIAYKISKNNNYLEEINFFNQRLNEKINGNATH